MEKLTDFRRIGKGQGVLKGLEIRKSVGMKYELSAG
jgi:hypothetical protein